MTGVKKVSAAIRLKMMALRLWNEFWVSPSDGSTNENSRRQKRGSSPSLTASRFSVRLVENWREISDNTTLQPDALP